LAVTPEHIEEIESIGIENILRSPDEVAEEIIQMLKLRDISPETLMEFVSQQEWTVSAK
jgi:hypothetical protein